MAHYVVFFNQQWVGDHPDEWFRERGRLAKEVVDQMKAAGVLVFAGGLDEDVAGTAFSADPSGGEVRFRGGRYAETEEYLGGLTVIEVADEAAARMWAGRIAEACGWPQEARPIVPPP